MDFLTKLEEKIQPLVALLVAIFTAVCVLAPGDTLRIKFVVFPLLMLAGLLKVNKSFFQGRNLYLLLMGTAFPICMIIHSMLVYGDLKEAIKGTYAASLILLYFVVVEYKVDYKKYFITFLKLMAIAIVTIATLDFLKIIDINSGVLNMYASKYGMAYIYTSPFRAAFYCIYFFASTLLVSLLGYCYCKKEYFMYFITFVAMIFSGIRSNMFIGVFFTICCFYHCVLQLKGKKRNLLLILLIVLSLAAFPVLYNYTVILMNKASSVKGDSIRIGQLQSFIRVLSEPKTFLIGMGFGSYFYDAGWKKFTNFSEIQYLDFLRKAGIVWFSVLMTFLLKPFFSRIPIMERLAYFCYLLTCCVNPYLYCANGFALFLYMYLRVRDVELEQESTLKENIS